MSCFKNHEEGYRVLQAFKPSKGTIVPRCCCVEEFLSLSPDQSCSFLSTLSPIRSYSAADYQ